MQSTTVEHGTVRGDIGVSTGTSKSNLATDIPELLHQLTDHVHDDGIRDIDVDLETARLLATWNAELIVENKVSEPRDILMTERTTLSWLKFSIVLIVASVAVFLNYRIETDESNSKIGDGNGNGNVRDSTVYATTIGLLFATLSLVGTICSAINYYKAIRNYASEKITTFDSRITTVFFSVCIATLIGINIALMIKSE
ncbi:hypothetical protein BVG19_g1007 [[Candida] boidinii]|nr:hypothetical protein BVG19_g1007 [[Candida] boidinii]OWB50616.1 hypothetical protein B5S27_g2168 [[Candida] boidinii]